MRNWRGHAPRDATKVETDYSKNYKNYNVWNREERKNNIEIKRRTNSKKENTVYVPDKPEPVNIPEEVLRGSTIIIEDIYKLFMGYSSAKYGLNKNLSISLFWLNGDNLRFKSYLTQKKHQKVKNYTKYGINSESDFLEYIFLLFIKISEEIKRNYIGIITNNIKRQGLEIIPEELPFIAGIREDLVNYKWIIEKSQLMNDNIKILYEKAFILLNELEYITNIELKL